MFVFAHICKIACAILGYYVWHIEGAVVGFILGVALDAGLLRQVVRRNRKKMHVKTAQQMLQARQNEVEIHVEQTFMVSTFSILGKLVKIDGKTTKEELAAVKRIMKESFGFDKHASKLALEIFNEARVSPTSFQYFASEFFSLFHAEPHIIENLIDVMFQVALADGPIDESEEKLIIEAAQIFQIHPERFQILADKHKGTELDDKAALPE